MGVVCVLVFCKAICMCVRACVYRSLAVIVSILVQLRLLNSQLHQVPGTVIKLCICARVCVRNSFYADVKAIIKPLH